jgi:DNA invertase Pin-like site-specific DNA recombinase
MTIKNGFDIRVSPKIYIKNRMFTVLRGYILKNLRSLAEIDTLKRLCTVMTSSAYKWTVASCFFIVGFFALYLYVFPLHPSLFSRFSSILFIGLTALSPGSDDEPSSKPSNEGEKGKEGSEKPKKKRKRKEKVTEDFLKLLFPGIDKTEVFKKEGPCVAAYRRVSAFDQVVNGDSLKCQKKENRDTAIKIGASRVYYIGDEGKSGKDFSARKLGLILQLAAAGKIQKLIVSEIDRVGRDAFEVLFFLFRLRACGVTLVTHEQEFDVKKFLDLIVVVVKAWSAEDQNRIRGDTVQRTKVTHFREQKWNLPVPIGYESKENWITKTPGFDPVIGDIFRLFLKYRNYSLVAEMVNDLHGKFLKKHLKKPLTREQVKEVFENTIYIGKPRLYGEATEEKFGIVDIDDPSLSYVDEDTFEKARAITKAKSNKYARRKKPLQELLETFGLEKVLEFLPHVGVFCTNCGNKMNDNGVGYKCPKCKTQLDVPKKTELQKLRECALTEEKRLQLLIKLLGKYKRKGKKWKDSEIERLLKKHEKENGGDNDEEEESEGT